MTPADYTTHKRILLQILKDIYTTTAISSSLGFKGGTAAMLFYNLERYSVDLDFDLTAPEQQDTVFETLQKIIQEYGTITEHREKYSTLLTTISPGAHKQHVKIEVNLRQFPSHYEFKNLLGVPMQVMVPADMFAHKLMALYERKGFASRDIFDVHAFFKAGWDFNKDIILARSTTTVRDVLEVCIDHIEKVDQTKLLDGLGSLLSEEKRIWAKERMKDDTLFFLRAAIAELR